MNPTVQAIVREAVTTGGDKRQADKAGNKSAKNRSRYYLNLFAEVAGPRGDALSVQDFLDGARLISLVAERNSQ